MRHLVSGRKLGRTASHRRAMLSNLATSLIKYGRVKTTLAKAKEVRGLAERLVGWAKQGDLSARRLARVYVDEKQTLQRLFSELGPRFRDRQGGYTRVYKSGWRAGDAAPMALIEYLGEEIVHKHKEQKTKKEKNKQTETRKNKQGFLEKEHKKEQKLHAEEEQAIVSEAGHKKTLFRKSSKGVGRSGGSKKGVT